MAELAVQAKEAGDDSSNVADKIRIDALKLDICWSQAASADRQLKKPTCWLCGTEIRLPLSSSQV